MNECLMCPLSKIDGTKRKNKKIKKKWKWKNVARFHSKRCYMVMIQQVLKKVWFKKYKSKSFKKLISRQL